MAGKKQTRDFRGIGLGVSTSIAAILLSLVLASVILLINGSNPLEAYLDMLQFGTRFDVFIDTVNRALPLFISAIAVAIGFKMNLFNIGVEGQYTISGIVAAYVGANINLPAPIHVIVILIVAMSVGAIWAGIPGILKVTRGIHEVISTIMLNAIAISFLAAWLLSVWSIDTGNPNEFNIKTATIPSSGRLPSLLGGSSNILNSFLIIAVIVGIGYWLYVYKTRPGYDLRASGLNPTAAQASGVSPRKTIVIAMLLSGAVAGLVGIPQVLGPEFGTYNYNLEFITLLGFNGITVALLGQNHPGGIAISAIFVAWLDTSSPILDITDAAPTEIITIMKGIIIFVMVIAFEYSRKIRETNEAKRSSALLLKAEEERKAGSKTQETKEQEPK